MDKESIYELQKIDCNCNDCLFMVRDMDKYNHWKSVKMQWQLNEFNAKYDKLNKIVNDFYRCNELEKGYTAEQELRKMKFQFDASNLISYGKCEKFNKDVSFIPAFSSKNDTFNCFKHRKDL